MPDMLVRLYQLPELQPFVSKVEEKGILVRRALAPEKRVVLRWVNSNFNQAWADECDVAFSREPLACFIAQSEVKIVGFACYNSISKGLFGPTGVGSEMRGKGIGATLLLMSLHALRAEGYSYAIIGGAGPTEFYSKVVGASVIEGSQPGIYRDMIRD